MMKAYVLHGIGRLSYDELPVPECPKGWALVKVKAAGICSSDIPRIFTKGTYHFPTIPGHEFSGVVEKVGSPEDETLIGKSVGIFPLIPCKNCEQCKKGNYELCENYDYVGSRRDGGFAELVAVPVWNLIPISSEVSFEEAAMLEPLAVALHAIKRGKVQPGESVGIIGTGMIGFAAAQWAVHMGASKVCIIGRSEEKRVLCKNMVGVEYMVETDSLPLFDLTLEAVGSPKAIATAIEHTQVGGRIVLMGNPAGDILLPQSTYWRILRKQITVVGTWNSSYGGSNKSDWTEARDALSEGAISVETLVSHKFTQVDLMKALELMKEHREPYCKVMTLWNHNE